MSKRRLRARGLKGWLRTLLHKHDLVPFQDGFKRRCACGREDWVMSNPYPRIGEPKHYWKTMWFGDKRDDF